MREPSAATLRLLRLPHGEGLPLPAYHSAHASGLDLAAAVADEAPLELAPGARALIPTGFVLELPPGCEAQIRPRSGLALKHGVTVLNSPGTIDADYRGELMVLLVNLGAEPFTIRRGDAHRPARRGAGGASARRDGGRAWPEPAAGRAVSAPPAERCIARQ